MEIQEMSEDTQNNGNASENGEQNNGTENTDHGTDNNAGNMIPQARLNKEIERRKAAESELTGVADTLAQDVPEEFQALIPNLPPAQKIQWLREAQKSGLFSQKVESNGPGAKRPLSSKREVNLDDMTPVQMMALGYGKN